MSLRVRLMAAYAGLIIFGFASLAVLAGGQISSAARRDFELRMSNEVGIVARALSETITVSNTNQTAAASDQNSPGQSAQDQNGPSQPNPGSGQPIPGQIPPDDQVDIPTEDELNAVLSSLSTQPDAEFQLILVQDRDRRPPQEGRSHPLPSKLNDYPELAAASQDAVLVDQRDNLKGKSMLYTAAPIVRGRVFIGYVQLSEPASALNKAVRERWETLGLGVAGIATVALLASIWLSTSLIRPLEKLRDSALRFSRGELSHRVAYQGRDEIGSVAQAFNQMAEQVQAMIEEQRAFASNTSHELRTPLTTMRLRTEALRQDDALDGVIRQQYIVELDDELTRLSKLVDDLVLLSRFDAKRAETGDDQIDLVRFVHSLYRTVSEQAQQHEIRLELEDSLPPSLPVNASLNHLMILFRNLFENAIKYTPAGGRIVWRISLEGSYAVLRLTDTGQGIAPEHLPHVFERFYRADKARSRSIPGTGLGLSLAQSIVGAYQGRMDISSPGPGLGTTVTVWWPVLAQTA